MCLCKSLVALACCVGEPSAEQLPVRFVRFRHNLVLQRTLALDVNRRKKTFMTNMLS